VVRASDATGSRCERGEGRREGGGVDRRG
jgi:hypothetical protein